MFSNLFLEFHHKLLNGKYSYEGNYTFLFWSANHLIQKINLSNKIYLFIFFPNAMNRKYLVQKGF